MTSLGEKESGDLLTEVIADLRALDAKATPIGWMAASKSSIVGLPIIQQPVGRVVASVAHGPNKKDYAAYNAECMANAQLIANMRNHLPVLLDAAERAERAASLVAQLRDQRYGMGDVFTPEEVAAIGYFAADLISWLKVELA